MARAISQTFDPLNCLGEMRHAAVVLILCLMPSAVYAQQATCRLQSIDKKLSGPALSSFLEACAEDAQKMCEKLASERRLEEPGRTIFVGKCLKTYAGFLPARR
jgi:hypothetical protein